MPVKSSVRKRLEAQGFCSLDDTALGEFAPWLRWSPALCTSWLAATVWAFHVGSTMVGFIVGIPLLLVAALVSVTHFCIPSLIYNTLFGKRTATDA